MRNDIFTSNEKRARLINLACRNAALAKGWFTFDVALGNYYQGLCAEYKRAYKRIRRLTVC